VKVKSLLWTGLGFCVLAGFIAVPVLLLRGALWIAPKLLPILLRIGLVVLALDLLVLMPLAFIRVTRGFAGLGFRLSGLLYGATLWFAGLILTFGLWGKVALVVGFLLLGVGVIPMAFLATLFAGMWSSLGLMFFLLLLAIGTSATGGVLLESS
jgi:hypothetical protein